MDGRETVTLRLPQDAANVMNTYLSMVIGTLKMLSLSITKRPEQ